MSTQTENVAQKEEHKEETQKSSRGERKFKKAMMKMGLKPLEGFSRCTIKTGKNMMLYIDNPFVMTTGVNEHNYLIFGEAKIFDFKSALGKENMEKFRKGRDAVQNDAVPETVVEEPETEATQEATATPDVAEEEIDASLYSEEDIASIIDYSKCDRKTALKALAKANGDVIDAISYVS